MEERLFIPCNDHDIPMVISYPESGNNFPCLLMLHGYMAYKEGDGYMFTKFAKELADNGIASARIDFVSMGENRYSRENYGLKVMLEETKTAFEYLQRHPRMDEKRIGIMGHSLGGRITFLSAGLPSKCLVSLNGAVNVKEKMGMKQPASFKTEKGDGYQIIHTSDGRAELLFDRFGEESDVYLNEDVYEYTNPILVCIGASDPTLDPEISYKFVRECGMPNVDEIVIQDANHTFNAKTKDYAKLYELISKVIPWLDENLK